MISLNVPSSAQPPTPEELSTVNTICRQCARELRWTFHKPTYFYAGNCTVCGNVSRLYSLDCFQVTEQRDSKV